MLQHEIDVVSYDSIIHEGTLCRSTLGTSGLRTATCLLAVVALLSDFIAHLIEDTSPACRFEILLHIDFGPIALYGSCE